MQAAKNWQKEKLHVKLTSIPHHQPERLRRRLQRHRAHRQKHESNILSEKDFNYKTDSRRNKLPMY